MTENPTLTDILKRPLIFIEGKGGVGKTTLALAIATALSEQGSRTLLVSIEDPLREPGEIKRLNPNLWHLNCEASHAFEEYAALKIGVPALTRIFMKNKLMRYLSKAAPGIHELVMLGKIWHDRLDYDHVIVDMPSTGYGITMFQSTINFTRLFKGGPIHRDSEAMLKTFNNPKEVGQLIVALAEEMPLQESIELKDYLLKMFPANMPGFVVNRCFPQAKKSSSSKTPDHNPDHWKSPVADSGLDYILKRTILESFNLKIWDDVGISYERMNYLPPVDGRFDAVALTLSKEIAKHIHSEGVA